ncbi:MAG: hypothetical protein UX68_C0008G0031 [Parcubacteria group bacterium GW2011_GWA2_46_9]|nr:MAG: hypothetical protein UX68_C0008G0031 [Parcubacteria group bacterium GW2011_GWA2_46_9]
MTLSLQGLCVVDMNAFLVLKDQQASISSVKNMYILFVILTN